MALPASEAAEQTRRYAVLKAQWQTMTPEQVARFGPLRNMLHGIEKDVPRTDRDLSFYGGEENSNLDVLQNLLNTYGMYNFDLGYVQGMSDLCSVLLHVLKDETTTFWAFVGLMDRMGSNFNMDQSGMHAHLAELGALIRFTDPELMDFFERHDAGNLFFAFRWLLVFFKREMSFLEVMQLWEVLWSDHYTRKFYLFVCCAILQQHRATLLAEHRELDTIIGVRLRLRVFCLF
jgi:hypothetical protein